MRNRIASGIFVSGLIPHLIAGHTQRLFVLFPGIIALIAEIVPVKADGRAVRGFKTLLRLKSAAQSVGVD